MWHWQLGGDDKGSIRGVVELSRLLGHMDESDTVVRVGAKAQQELQTVVDAMFHTEEHLRVLAELPKRVVFGASDASAKAGAGVGWSHQGVARIVHGPQPWPADLKLKDINVRETWASTNTLKEILAGSKDVIPESKYIDIAPRSITKENVEAYWEELKRLKGQ